MGSKTKTTQSSNSTQTNAPPTWTMPGLEKGAGMVTNAMNQIPGMDQAYSGDFVAQADPYQRERAQAAYGTAAQNAGAMSGWLNQQVQQGQYQPTYTTTLPAAGPYNMGDRQRNLDQVIKASTAPVFQQLQQQILPGIKSSALDSGAYTNDRAMAVMPQQAIAQSTKEANDLGLQLGYQDYQNYEQRRLQAEQMDRDTALQSYGADTSRQGQNAQIQQNWMGMLPDLTNTVLSQGTAAGDIYSNIAAQAQQDRQSAIDNALTREQYNFSRPFMGLDTAAQLLQAYGGNYGTTTGKSDSTSTQSTSGAGAIAQGILGVGAGLGSAFMGGGAPLASMFGKIGKAGAGLGSTFISPSGYFGSSVPRLST